MASTVTSPQAGCTLSASLKGSASATVKPSAGVSDSTPVTYAVGNTAGQVNKVYTTTVTVNTSGATLIDLTSGITDALGASIVFAKVSAIKITNKSTTTGENITVGGGTNGLFTALPFTLEAGTGTESFTLCKGAGITVDGTHKILQLAAASGSAVTVTVTIFGR